MKIMSTKRYVLGTAVLLLVLCSIASAGQDPSEWISDTRSYLGPQRIDQLFPPHDSIAGYSLNVGPYNGGPAGHVYFDSGVVMEGHAGQGIPPWATCELRVGQSDGKDGGILNIPDTTDGIRMWESQGNTRIYVNTGTMIAGKIENWGEKAGEGCNKIEVLDGTLIVKTGYDPDNIGSPTNPATWLDNGSLLTRQGGKVKLESPAPGYGAGSVKIYAVYTSFNPAPAADETIVDLNLPNLCFDGYGAYIYRVWFGAADADETNYGSLLTPLGTVITDPNIETNMCISLSGKLPLSVPATYSWAVEGYADVNDVTGQPDDFMRVRVYQFSTSAIPVVKVQPATQAVSAGQTAVFTTEVESYTALTSYNWYKTTAPSTPIAGTISGPVNHRYQLTLTVPNVQWADQAAFYCTAVNASGSVNTAEANLGVKVMLAHWAFETNLNDTAPKTQNTIVYNGTAAATPSYVTSSGSDTKALLFDGTSQYVTLPAGFENFRAGMTIAVWAVMDLDADPNARYVDFGNTATPTDSVYLSRRETAVDDDELTFRGGSDVRLNAAVSLSHWDHFVVAMDGTGAVTGYRNGLPLAAVADTYLLPVQTLRNNNYIGRKSASAVAKFKGKIGDLRVYNYAISADEAATLYSDIAGSYCREAQDYDWNGDCRVSLADFASMADTWLESGMYYHH
jgi:hypothetical protein